jgi:hypothetical protein
MARLAQEVRCAELKLICLDTAALAPLFAVARDQLIKRMRACLPAFALPLGQPKRSPRRGAFETCSISQNAQTKAAPNPTMTPRRTKVRAGAVSVANIAVLNADRPR